MNKKILVGLGISALLAAVLVSAVVFTEWDDYTTNDSPEGIPFDGGVDDTGELDQNSLNYALFEQYGPVLLIVALLMFGAMIGGVCVAREEVENDDTD
jgi:NADH:ubiquinone oxidoreductase subunit 6 (subunit J)